MSALSSSLVDAEGTRLLLAWVTGFLFGVQASLIMAPLRATDKTLNLCINSSCNFLLSS